MVTKGEGWGRAGGEGGRRGLWGSMIGAHGVCGVTGKTREGLAQRRQIGTLWHLTTLMDSDCNGVWGDSIIRVNVITTLFSCETFIRVYINDTLKKKS